MVAPGFLQNAAVKDWLGGVVPAWTLLDQWSFSALRAPPSPLDGPIKLATDLTLSEIGKSAIARNALILLHAASVGPGLKLTATGNLSRKVVAEMWDLFTWPDFGKEEERRFHKVINEPDFLALFLIRHLTEAAGLVKKRKDHLKITPTGLQVLESPGHDALQALLFHLAFWRLDLGYLNRGLLHDWPQRDIGIVLWSLSISANEWQSRERLTRMCTIPINGVIESEWDRGAYAMDGTILRPLLWFGLLEHRADPIPEQGIIKAHFYRKSLLFDRFITFTVRLETDGMSRH
ncbi:MAG: hypothetical protein U1E67_11835 [Hyphomicrobiales bacterium]